MLIFLPTMLFMSLCSVTRILLISLSTMKLMYLLNIVPQY